MVILLDLIFNTAKTKKFIRQRFILLIIYDSYKLLHIYITNYQKFHTQYILDPILKSNLKA